MRNKILSIVIGSLMLLSGLAALIIYLLDANKTFDPELLAGLGWGMLILLGGNAYLLKRSLDPPMFFKVILMIIFVISLVLAGFFTLMQSITVISSVSYIVPGLLWGGTSILITAFPIFTAGILTVVFNFLMENSGFDDEDGLSIVSTIFYYAVLIILIVVFSILDNFISGSFVIVGFFFILISFPITYASVHYIMGADGWFLKVLIVIGNLVVLLLPLLICLSSGISDFFTSEIPVEKFYGALMLTPFLNIIINIIICLLFSKFEDIVDSVHPLVVGTIVLLFNTGTVGLQYLILENWWVVLIVIGIIPLLTIGITWIFSFIGELFVNIVGGVGAIALYILLIIVGPIGWIAMLIMAIVSGTGGRSSGGYSHSSSDYSKSDYSSSSMKDADQDDVQTWIIQNGINLIAHCNITYGFSVNVLEVYVTCEDGWRDKIENAIIKGARNSHKSVENVYIR